MNLRLPLSRSPSASFIVIAALFQAVDANPQAIRTLDGNWEGTMVREGASLPIRFDFRTNGGVVTGRFTSETQSAMEYPIAKVDYSPPALHWRLGSSLVFDGVVSPQAISGTFLDGKAKGTFSLEPVRIVQPPYRREELTFRNGSVALSGTLLLPRSAGLHPGIVFLHGSGAESRWGTPFFLADRFARAGIAALVFDKRGVGQSTGDWKTINYSELAEDYLSAVQFLSGNPMSIRNRSASLVIAREGTISPLIASRPGAVAFVIAAAAIGVGPIYQEDLFRTRNDLIDEGFTEPDLSHAMDFYSLWIETMRTGEGIDEYEKARSLASTEKWFAKLGIPPRDSWIWKWYPPVATLNPLPLWEKVTVPVLLIYGEHDRNTPVDPSLAGIGNALHVAGNRDYTPIIIPGAAHNLTIQWEPGQPFFWWYTAPGYTDLLTEWVRARFSGKN